MRMKWNLRGFNFWHFFGKHHYLWRVNVYEWHYFPSWFCSLPWNNLYICPSFHVVNVSWMIWWWCLHVVNFWMKLLKCGKKGFSLHFLRQYICIYLHIFLPLNYYNSSAAAGNALFFDGVNLAQKLSLHFCGWMITHFSFHKVTKKAKNLK